MSKTTTETTIRQWVQSHTKDEIAWFFEDQMVKKDAEIERLKKALDQAIERARLAHSELVTEDVKNTTRYEVSQTIVVFPARHPELAQYLRDKEGQDETR